MKPKNQSKDHPEITDIKTVCEVSPDTKSTKSVCDKVRKEKPTSSNKKEK